MADTSFTITLPSEKRTSGTLSDAKFVFSNVLQLKQNYVVIPSVMLPSINNIRSVTHDDGNVFNNTYFKVDSANGTDYTTYTITEGEYIDMGTLINAVRVACYPAITTTVNVITKKVTISSVDNFSVSVTKNDLLNYLGFSVGVLKDANTYTATSSPNLFPDIIRINWDQDNRVRRGPNFYQSVSTTLQSNSELMSVFYTELGTKLFNELNRTRLVIDSNYQTQSMRVWLTDGEGFPISIFNGFVLKLQVMSQDIAKTM